MNPMNIVLDPTEVEAILNTSPTREWGLPQIADHLLAGTTTPGMGVVLKRHVRILAKALDECYAHAHAHEHDCKALPAPDGSSGGCHEHPRPEDVHRTL